MTTNNPNSFPLNCEINRYSFHEQDQIAYQRMQEVGFKIARILIEMPLGTMADLGKGEFLFVAPYAGKIEVFTTPDWTDNCKLDDVNWFFQSDYQGLGASDLDDHRADMEAWLKNPGFRQCMPPDHAFKAVANLEERHGKDTDHSTAATIRREPLTRYEHENLKNLIDGYMIPTRPIETREQQFNRAKAELITNLERQLQRIRAFTYADMVKKMS
ncbi:hypothetical protein IIE18_10505 [Pseudomonas sp. V1]|uniref:hypothetical protein n=1 Tax=Pseudomonas arcuscaelestis TaxID=2710591 RepID=UPI00194013EE|nr:hypothetical protein [Pseudomonas arcuscaelestis]MBM3105570.1 hypothetical protein [Pseudomonas arcuscaelestis]